MNKYPEGSFFSFDEYKVKEDTLVILASHEDRGFASIMSLLETYNTFEEVFIITLRDLLDTPDDIGKLPLNSLDLEKQERYRFSVIKNLIKNDIKFFEISGSMSDLYKVAQQLNKRIDRKDNVLIDISNFPRELLLEILRWCDSSKLTFLYSRPRFEGKHEEEFTIGVKGINVAKGYEGKIRLHKSLLLILVLGFEGSRSLFVFRKFEPARCLALYSDPINLYQNEKREEYLKILQENNFQLVSNQRVEADSIDSINPFLFKMKLDKLMKDRASVDSENIVIHGIGPKPQMIGMYLWWKENQYAQVVHSVPTRRGNPSNGVGSRWIYKIKGA